MWAGFAINAVTGVMLFASDATVKARQPVFYVKLTLDRPGAGGHRGDPTDGGPRARSHATPSASQRQADASAALSLLLWAGSRHRGTPDGVSLSRPAP